MLATDNSTYIVRLIHKCFICYIMLKISGTRRKILIFKQCKKMQSEKNSQSTFLQSIIILLTKFHAFIAIVYVFILVTVS